MRNVVAMLGLLAALLLGGCATSASPHFIRGSYYMTGDANCRSANVYYLGRITCFDKRGNATGYRDEMTSEQLQMYQTNVARQQMEMAQLNETIRQAGNSFNQMAQQSYRQAQQYAPPPVAPISPQSGSTVVCLKAGNYVSCNSGSGYDTKCNLIGNVMSCRD